MERRAEPLKPAEVTERAYLESLSDALYADPLNAEELGMAMDVAEAIVAARNEADRQQRSERGERTELADESFTDYLNNIGRKAVLGNRETEYRVFWVMEVGSWALSRLERPELIEGREREFFYLAQLRDWAYDEVFVSNARLVVAQAKKHARHQQEIPDLTSIGNEGLHAAIEKFDPHRETKFSTHAVWWIRQSMQRGAPEVDGSMRIPVHIHTDFNSFQRIRREYRERTGEEMTDEELAEASGKSLDAIRATDAAMKTSRDTLPMNMQVGEDGDTEVGELLAVHHSDDDQATFHSHDVLVRLGELAAELGVTKSQLAIFAADSGLLDAETAADVLAANGAVKNEQRRRIVRHVRLKLQNDVVLSLLTDGASDE